MNAQEQVLAIYQQSLKNLETDAPDAVDEVIVALWGTVVKLQAQNAELQKMAEEPQLKIAELTSHIDILETRLAIANGTYTLEVTY